MTINTDTMAKYSYAPVSVDESANNKPHGRARANDSHDEVVNERMPMAVGVCVLVRHLIFYSCCIKVTILTFCNKSCIMYDGFVSLRLYLF